MQKNKNVNSEQDQQTAAGNIAEPEPTTAVLVKKQRENFLYATLVILGLVIIGLAVWGFLQFRANKIARTELEKVQQNKAVLNSGDSQQVINQVAALMILPQNEQPTVATVTDLAKLQGQPFFANAQVGDKVLIYSQAGKAILYRPSSNKIIELAPLNAPTSAVSPPPAASNQTAGKANQLTVEIRNGSGKTGAAQNLRDLLSASGNFTVTKIGNAKSVYLETVLYVANSKASLAEVSTLRQLSSSTMVSALPAGEPQSSADALIIIGKQ